MTNANKKKRKKTEKERERELLEEGQGEKRSSVNVTGSITNGPGGTPGLNPLSRGSGAKVLS
jgi:hypothetical protein